MSATRGEAFGVAIYELRRQLGISLRKLSSTSGVRMGHLSKIEHGERRPLLGTVDRLIAGLDLHPPESDMLYWAAGFTPPDLPLPSAAVLRELEQLREQLRREAILRGPNIIKVTNERSRRIPKTRRPTNPGSGDPDPHVGAEEQDLYRFRDVGIGEGLPAANGQVRDEPGAGDDSNPADALLRGTDRGTGS